MPSNQSKGLIYIQGQKDTIIKTLRRVKTAPGRRKENLFIVEGLDLCTRALHYGANIHSVICTEQFALSTDGQQLCKTLPLSCPIYVSSLGLISKCLEAKPTPHCLALVHRQTYPIDHLLTHECPLILGIDHGDHADNLGMVLRSAEAAAVTGVLLSADTVDPFGRKVVRGSRGGNFHVPISIADNILDAIQHAQSHGVQVITTSANTDQFYHEINYQKPSLVIIGNEHNGISDAVLHASDHCVRIPMLGKINSLNIAVAGSIMLFEAQRQRQWQAASIKG